MTTRKPGRFERILQGNASRRRPARGSIPETPEAREADRAKIEAAQRDEERSNLIAALGLLSEEGTKCLRDVDE